MEAMAVFLESLKEIMGAEDIGVAELSVRIGCNKSAIRRWMSKHYFPEPATLIKLSFSFNISIDYMFGLSDKRSIIPLYNSVDFYNRYIKLKNQKGVTDYKVAKECKIRSSTLSKWKSLNSLPETESLLKLALYFNCSMDYLLGLID